MLPDREVGEGEGGVVTVPGTGDHDFTRKCSGRDVQEIDTCIIRFPSEHTVLELPCKLHALLKPVYDAV